nr:hypothetical protein DA06_11365 [Georgenia sp. SUBG003]
MTFSAPARGLGPDPGVDGVDDDAALVVEQEVHGPHGALEGDERGLLRVRREAEAAGEVVAGAERDDRHRAGPGQQAQVDERVEAAVHRPVSPEHDDLAAGRAAQRLAGALGAVGHHDLDVRTGTEHRERGAHGGVVGGARGGVREDEEGAGAAHGRQSLVPSAGTPPK